MKFIQLKCPNCNANLEAEDTLDTIYCKYCGTRIVIADQTKELIEAKTKLKMADKELEREQILHQQEMEKKRYEDKQSIKTALYVLILVPGFLLAWFGVMWAMLSFLN